jgi:DNA-binding response OmpR family regulator
LSPCDGAVFHDWFTARRDGQWTTGSWTAIRRSPVLFVSGYAQGAIAEHGLLEASMEFLPKPFTPSKLLARVRSIRDERGEIVSLCTEGRRAAHMESRLQLLQVDRLGEVPVL